MDSAADSPQSASLSPEEEAKKESDMSFISVMDSIKKLSLHGIDGRYFGPASNLSFMNQAFLKVHGREPGPNFSVKKEHWRNWLLHPVRSHCIFNPTADSPLVSLCIVGRRDGADSTHLGVSPT